MGENTITGLVEGGKASAGPPLGPALGSMGVNIGEVIAEINKKTAAFSEIKVPIKIIVDTTTKKFRVEVGTPPTSALILKELNIKKGAKASGEIVGNITMEQVRKIIEAKSEKIYGRTLEEKAKQVVGTCKSMGISCENQDPREIIRKIDSREIKLK